MTPELLQRIQRCHAEGEVGTLCLGLGSRTRRLFFSGSEVHLLETGVDRRVHPGRQLLDPEQLPRPLLDELAARIRSDEKRLSERLAERGLLPAAELAGFALDELIEEMLLACARHGKNFAFERGQVPEELLLPQAAAPPGVPMDRFLAALQERRCELNAFARSFPSLSEIVVLSEVGLRMQHTGDDWAFQQVAALVDGFRPVRAVLADSVLFPHATGRVLVTSLQRGLIKKTLFPEFQGLDPEQLAPREAARWADLLRASLAAAVDEMPLRQRLAVLCLRAGDADQAVGQLSTIGDMWEARGELTKALDNFREALRWEPEALILQEKVVRVYLRFAEQAFRTGKDDEGRQYLEEALCHNSNDLELYVRILDSYPDPEQAIQHALPRLLKIMMRAGHRDLAIALFEELVRRAPQHDALRKRFVNFLLDHDAQDRAVEELEQLANQLLERGAQLEAKAIYDKIAMLAPERRAASRTRSVAGVRAVPIAPAAAPAPPAATATRARQAGAEPLGATLPERSMPHSADRAAVRPASPTRCPAGGSQVVLPTRGGPASRATRSAGPRTPGRRRLVTPLGVFLMGLLAAFGLYQGYAFLQVRELNRSAIALASARLPEPGSTAHHRQHVHAEEALRELRSFRRRHFASLWSRTAGHFEQLIGARQALLEHELNRAVGSLIAAGEQAEVRGRFDEARNQYQEARDRAGGTHWHARATQQLQRIDTYLGEAADLARRQQAALDRRELDLAFELAQDLVDNYPRAVVAQQVTLPIHIRSTPPGATVRTEDHLLGHTPLVVRVHPLEATTLWLQHDGFEPRAITIDQPTTHRMDVSLTPLGGASPE